MTTTPQQIIRGTRKILYKIPKVPIKIFEGDKKSVV
jgi:hypothetical protein